MTAASVTLDDIPPEQFDVIVVGAGFGGVYSIYRFLRSGLSVLCLEAGGGVGGVWYHNAYPGARVDLESMDYCYFFSEEVYREWRWTERYSPQPEILKYINFVADKYGLKEHMRFNRRVIGAQRDEASNLWTVRTDNGESHAARFLVMATGNLSEPRKPAFEGIDDFEGEWVTTSHWPRREVKLEGRRIGLVGTGSSGVQAAPVMAEKASRLTIFQRTPHYSIPARNGPMDQHRYRAIADNFQEARQKLYRTRAANNVVRAVRPSTELSEEEKLAALEDQWQSGGQAMNYVFADQNLDFSVNDFVGRFVDDKIRRTVRDPLTAEKLIPTAYPFGTKRLALDTGYYEMFNRDNVALVDLRSDPIRRFTRTGIETESGHHALDLVVFALGFHAFTGALDAANIRNAAGAAPTDHWKQGPRTMLGLATAGFANFFFLTGPGSPSVDANMVPMNEQNVDWVADLLDHMRERGFSRVEVTPEGEQAWVAHHREVSNRTIRANKENYKLHVNADGSKVYMPYGGGFDQYVERADAIARSGYPGFAFN